MTAGRDCGNSSRLPAFLFLPLLLAVLALGCNREGSAAAGDAVSNVRLGMAPRDVRDRFQPGTEGSWQTALGAGDDTVLEWTAGGRSPEGASKPTMLTARFEFHLAMLVAIRARTSDPAPPRDEISSTPKTVSLRARAPEGGTSITVLARDCPTHKDEAERLAAKAPR